MTRRNRRSTGDLLQCGTIKPANETYLDRISSVAPDDVQRGLRHSTDLVDKLRGSLWISQPL